MPADEKRARERFARNLRELRAARGFSQEQFAIHADISRGYYGNIERGKHSPSLTTVVRLARALNVSVQELLEGVE